MGIFTVDVKRFWLILMGYLQLLAHYRIGQNQRTMMDR